MKKAEFTDKVSDYQDVIFEEEAMCLIQRLANPFYYTFINIDILVVTLKNNKEWKE